MRVHNIGEVFTPETARQLAAAHIEAADEIDRLTRSQ